MTNRIPDRLLERARLGELSEEEMVELVARLEAEEGGTQRLDELIDADDAFLEQYPAEAMVPFIRNRLERRQRDRDRNPEPEGAPMLSLSRMTRSPAPALAALAALVVLVAGVVAFFATSRPEPAVVADSSTSRSAAEIVEEQRSQIAALAEAVNRSTTGAPRPAHAEAFGEPSHTVELTVGETVEYPAAGLTRVALSRSKVAEAAPNDSETSLVITATAPGETLILLVREGSEETQRLVVRPSGDFVPFADRLDRAMSPNNELVMEPGEKLKFDAANVRRIEIDKVALLDVRHDEQRAEFTLTAKEVGLTGMRVVMAEPNPTTPIYVRIVEPFDRSFDITDLSLFEVPDGLEIECDDETVGALGVSRRQAARFNPAKLNDGEQALLVRVITTPTGAVSAAHAEYSSLEGNDLEKCVLDAVRESRFEKAAGPRTALFGYRFPAPTEESEELDETFLDEAEIDEDAFRQVRRKALQLSIKARYSESIELCRPYAKAKVECARVLAVGYKRLDDWDEACRWFDAAGLKADECDGEVVREKKSYIDW